jgi:hypothetical protein
MGTVGAFGYASPRAIGVDFEACYVTCNIQFQHRMLGAGSNRGPATIVSD